MIIHSIILIVGILLLVFGIAELKRRLAFVKNSERSVGRVVQLKEKKDDEGTYYYPVFEIHTRKREVMTYVLGTGTSPTSWKLGQEAVFIFDPEQPESIRMLRYWVVFGWPLSLLAVAVDILLIGIGYFAWYVYWS